MWDSTAEVEAFSASVLACVLQDIRKHGCHVSGFTFVEEGRVLGCSDLNQLCWLQFWAVLSGIEDGFRIAVGIYCAKHAYCCQMPQLQSVTVICS